MKKQFLFVALFVAVAAMATVFADSASASGISHFVPKSHHRGATRGSYAPRSYSPNMPRYVRQRPAQRGFAVPHHSSRHGHHRSW